MFMVTVTCSRGATEACVGPARLLCEGRDGDEGHLFHPKGAVVELVLLHPLQRCQILLPGDGQKNKADRLEAQI